MVVNNPSVRPHFLFFLGAIHLARYNPDAVWEPGYKKHGWFRTVEDSFSPLLGGFKQMRSVKHTTFFF